MPASFSHIDLKKAAQDYAASPAGIANLARADALRRKPAQDLAAAQAAQAAHDKRQGSFLDSLVIPERYLDPASQAWVNPYYTGPATGYHRFDPNEVGAGLTHSGPGLPTAFDRAIASQWTNPIDLAGYYGSSDLAEKAGRGIGFLPAASAAEAFKKEKGITTDPRLQAALDFNRALEGDKALYRQYTSDPAYGEAFNALGLDISSLNSPEALAALSPDVKASMYDIAARNRQFKNQRAKRGIGDSLGGFGGLLGPIFGGLVGGPLGGALLGGVTGGFDGGPLGALTGALSGYGIGSTLTGGITNPFTGTNYTGPIAYSGVPSGINPLDLYGYTPSDPSVFRGATGIGLDPTHGGYSAPTFSGPGSSFDFPDISGIPKVPGGTSDTPTDPTNPFSFPPILVPPSGSPGSDDDDATTPPFVIPGITGIPGTTGTTGTPPLPTPSSGTSLAIGAGGGGGRRNPFKGSPMPPPPDPRLYFSYGQNPFGII